MTNGKTDPGMEAGPVKNFSNRGFSRGMIVNIVLFIGLLALYALHFSKGAEDEAASEGESVAVADVERRIDDAFNSIAYVDNEVLLEDYLLAIEMRAELESEQRRLESDIERRQRNFQADVERFQTDIQSGNISMENAQMREQELMQRQQDLFQLSDTYRERLSTREFEMNNELLDKIGDFLARYNREKGYDFILGYARGGGILYAKPVHDITSEVLEQLNSEYEGQN